ncbi:hypothetical protein EFS38_11515 [Dickeya undicola]|uniref:Uncharacterized protein n=1 Tax=Dickeya undicola TaxID=1577887 RepID=A0ABX9WSF0_9GAMM|nr:hypothetical protein EFS38_11515 [Dickeya undicola]
MNVPLICKIRKRSIAVSRLRVKRSVAIPPLANQYEVKPLMFAAAMPHGDDLNWLSVLDYRYNWVVFTFIRF